MKQIDVVRMGLDPWINGRRLTVHYDKVLKRYSIPPIEDKIQSPFIFRFRFPPIFYRTKFAQRVNPVLYVTQTRILFQILLSPEMMISRRQISVAVKLDLSSQIPNSDYQWT